AREHAGRQPAAVVAGISEVDVAVGIALRADAHVVAAGRLGQLDRRQPAVAEISRGEYVPATLGSPAVGARPAAGAMAIGEPDPAVAVLLQLRQLVELLGVGGKDRLEVGGRLQPLAVGQALDPNAARLVEADRLALLVEVAGVLAPLR